jgi:drug/metabolite transporter (DMT)-like permease
LEIDWVIFGLSAGLLLGTYDFFSKFALREKRVLEVVFLSSIIGSMIWLPFFFMPENYSAQLTSLGLNPKSLSASEQLLILPKSLLMVLTWILSYYAIKELPLSISAGVRASGPIWTAFGAMIFLSEVLSLVQWLGIFVAACAYYFFSLIGKKEGLAFGANIWVLCMLAATVMSSVNALYDKFVIVSLDLDMAAVQAYSAIQRAMLVLLLLPWIAKNLEIRSIFGRNWAIIAISITYVIAEFVYLWSVNGEGAMISVISILRRTNLIMVFGLSAIFLKENFILQKSFAISGVLVGITLVLLS